MSADSLLALQARRPDYATIIRQSGLSLISTRAVRPIDNVVSDMA